ncbi:Protein RER1 like [Schistosoma japonicum]|nr:Protein RER1 like [Schistosoma japonicum]
MEFYTQEIQGCSSKPEFLRSCEVVSTFSCFYQGKQKIQYLYDAVTPHAVGRWCFTVFLILFYILRIFITQGYHLVTYVMGIFLLNRLVDFLSPKIVPESSTDEVLPTKSSEEFRPFLRQLSELKFWNSCTICLFISIICTYWSFLDIPVVWPILVMYFVILFYLTMKRQISHMIKYRYLPFTYGKPRHQSSGMRF